MNEEREQTIMLTPIDRKSYKTLQNWIAPAKPVKNQTEIWLIKWSHMIALHHQRSYIVSSYFCNTGESVSTFSSELCNTRYCNSTNVIPLFAANMGKLVYSTVTSAQATENINKMEIIIDVKWGSDSNKPFILSCNASHYGIEAVLSRRLLDRLIRITHRFCISNFMNCWIELVSDWNKELACVLEKFHTYLLGYIISHSIYRSQIITVNLFCECNAVPSQAPSIYNIHLPTEHSNTDIYIKPDQGTKCFHSKNLEL